MHAQPLYYLLHSYNGQFMWLQVNFQYLWCFCTHAGLPHLLLSIACSMQKWSEKACMVNPTNWSAVQMTSRFYTRRRSHIYVSSYREARETRQVPVQSRTTEVWFRCNRCKVAFFSLHFVTADIFHMSFGTLKAMPFSSDMFCMLDVVFCCRLSRLTGYCKIC